MHEVLRRRDVIAIAGEIRPDLLALELGQGGDVESFRDDETVGFLADGVDDAEVGVAVEGAQGLGLDVAGEVDGGVLDEGAYVAVDERGGGVGGGLEEVLGGY